MESGLKDKKEKTNVHEGQNLNTKSVHEEMKPQSKSRELICTSKDSKNFSQNIEEKFQASCQYCGWSGANNQLVLSLHAKHFHQDDIDLDRAFEAEVKAGLVEPLDC